MRFLRIDVSSPYYPSEVALRDVVLRNPLGRKWTAADFDRDREGAHFVIVEDDIVIACIILQPAGVGLFEMRSVAVASDRWRQGLATALLAFAEDDICRSGPCMVVVDARTDALAFYETSGYRFGPDRFWRHGLEHACGHKALG
jgi:GNAT superfamily N-acetyltransferase